MNIVILGVPGAGKGTQAKMLSERLKIPHISTGDIFRNAIKEGTELGKTAADHIEQGKLVPDDVTFGIVKGRIGEKDCKNGFLLDGFPRTIAQADALSALTDIDMAVDIDVPAERLIARISGRRMCPDCGAGYHVSMYKSDKCEKCGAKLYIRDDDKEETVKNRIEVYTKNTQPLIAYYEKKGILKRVDGDKKPDEVLAQIMGLVEPL